MSNNTSTDVSTTRSGPVPPVPTEDELWALIAAERLRLADDLAALGEQQLAVPSQCDAWSVRDVLAHLVTPFQLSTPKFVFTLIKNRANFDRTMIELTAGTAARYETAELIELLRANAENRWTPPGEGAGLLLSEIVVHGQDIRNPLGLANPVPAATVALALELVEKPGVAADYRRRIEATASAAR